MGLLGSPIEHKLLAVDLIILVRIVRLLFISIIGIIFFFLIQLESVSEY